MNEFLKIAYSTEYVSEQKVCYDTTSFDCSIIYDYRESYAEYRYECRFDDEGWN